MRNAFTRLCLTIILVIVVRPMAAAELTWLTDLNQAEMQAKTEKKMVLLFFHDSDGCPPCVQMQKEVFESPAFIDFARQALVVVSVDFPETTEQSAEAKETNLALKSKFNIGSGLPSIVLLNGAGETVFQEMGYAGGGPAEVLANLRCHPNISPAIKDSAHFQNLSVEEFAEFAADKRYVILDVRTSQEFKAGHLPGAINLDVNASDFEEQAKALDKDKAYLVHCASGVRSVKACDKLGQIDFQKLYNLPGGFKAWVKAGQPVEK